VTKTQCQVPSQINVTLTDEQRESLRASLSGGAGGPLVHPPQPALTDEEREAIQRLIEDYEQDGEPASAVCVATLRTLLERLK
jgi:hypothetical protein